MNNKKNPLMDDEVDENANGWKARSETLQENLEACEKKAKDLEAGSKKLIEKSTALINRLNEMFNHKDFKSVFALAEAQGFKYHGPLPQEPAEELIKVLNEVNTGKK